MGTFSPVKGDYLFICSFATENFPLEGTRKAVFHPLSNRILQHVVLIIACKVLKIHTRYLQMPYFLLIANDLQTVSFAQRDSTSKGPPHSFLETS